jgi:hypothetical protein
MIAVASNDSSRLRNERRQIELIRSAWVASAVEHEYRYGDRLESLGGYRPHSESGIGERNEICTRLKPGEVPIEFIVRIGVPTPFQKTFGDNGQGTLEVRVLADDVIRPCAAQCGG